MPFRWRGPSSMWQVLALGFVVILSLWLITSVQVTRRMTQVQDAAAMLNARYLLSQDALAAIRGHVLLAAAYVRDAVVAPGDTEVDEYRRLSQGAVRAMQQVVDSYQPFLPESQESTRMAALSVALASFTEEVDRVLGRQLTALTPDERLRAGRLVATTRDRVVGASETFQSGNRNDYVLEQARITDMVHDTQDRMALQLGAALVASLLIGLLATRRAGHLERHLQQERSRAEGTAGELQRLSARLVTVEETERRTIARELHDEVGQLLSAVKVELALVRRTADTVAQGRLLASAESMTDEALHGVRDLSRLLHPALLDDLGLPAAVDWYLQGFGRRTGIRVELVQEGMDQRLPSAAEAGAYRIIQEALSNVARHARASLCRVLVQRSAGVVRLTVEDDGIGFDAAEARGGSTPSGLGLIGIRERAWQLGGSVHLESAPSKGTRLTVELPVPEADTSPVPGADAEAAAESAPSTHPAHHSPTHPLVPATGPAPHQT